jgi:hypothetical protein
MTKKEPTTPRLKPTTLAPEDKTAKVQGDFYEYTKGLIDEITKMPKRGHCCVQGCCVSYCCVQLH